MSVAESDKHPSGKTSAAETPGYQNIRYGRRTACSVPSDPNGRKRKGGYRNGIRPSKYAGCRRLFDNDSFLFFDTGLLTGEGTQVVDAGTTYDTHFIDFDTLDVG